MFSDCSGAEGAGRSNEAPIQVLSSGDFHEAERVAEGSGQNDVHEHYPEHRVALEKRTQETLYTRHR